VRMNECLGYPCCALQSPPSPWFRRIAKKLLDGIQAELLARNAVNAQLLAQPPRSRSLAFTRLHLFDVPPLARNDLLTQALDLRVLNRSHARTSGSRRHAVGSSTAGNWLSVIAACRRMSIQKSSSATTPNVIIRRLRRLLAYMPNMSASSMIVIAAAISPAM
jgi:hypothetical protein